MKNLYRSGKFFAALLLGIFACGCIDVEYVGQSFPPLPEDVNIPVYTEKNPAPEKVVYRSIGRVLVTANDDCPAADIRSELEKTARENGAEAVKIVHWNSRLLGTAAPAGSANWQPNDNNTGRTLSGGYIYRDSFGSAPARLDKPVRKFRETEVEALLLVTEKRFKEFAGQKAAPAIDAKEEKANPLRNKSREEVLKITPVAPQNENKTPEKSAVKVDLSGDQSAPVVL